MSAKEYDVKKKYKLVPPEGGWGYMIVVAVIINLSTSTMFQGSFGLLYKDFMEDIGMSSTHMTMMMGIGAFSAAISGFLTDPLLSIMSTRQLTLVAAMAFNIGMISSVFVNTIFTFFICVGILPAVGVGIIFNLSFTMLNEYFVRRRLMAISIAQTVVALITMIVPMFVKWSLEEYGYRSTLLLVSGITSNNLLGVALIQPVEQHMKKVEIQDSEMNVLLRNEKQSYEKPKMKLDLNLTNADDNVTKVNEKPQDLLAENKTNNVLRKLIDSLLDKSLRKKFLLSCVSLGPALCVFVDITYTTMLPQALSAAKWSQDNIALALSFMNFGDLAMRVIFIFCSTWMLKLGSQEVYVLGIIIALVARLGTLWSKTTIANMIYITLTGVGRCSMALLIPVVIADAVPPQKFTAAMGIFMMMSGVINLIFGPAIGAVRDLTDSYGAAFYLIASCLAMITLFWLIELCYKKNKHKRLQRREYLKQKKINK